MRAAQLVLAAFAAYVGVRAAFVFLGASGAVVLGAASAVAAYAAWRRPLRAVAAGLVLGATASVVALAV